MTNNKHSENIKKMFNEISQKYDFVNNLISFNKHKKVKVNAIEALKIPNNKNIKVLDLCCGSGDFSYIIQKKYPNVQVFGLDFSSEMLKIAQKKCKKVEFFEANALDLPFCDLYFDFVVVGFGLRNVEDIDIALDEIYRVLKNGGKFLHLDFNSDCKYNKIYDAIIPYLVKIFIKDISPYIYLLNSKNKFYSNDELIEKFEDFGFGFENYKKMYFDIVAYQVMKKY